MTYFVRRGYKNLNSVNESQTILFWKKWRKEWLVEIRLENGCEIGAGGGGVCMLW